MKYRLSCFADEASSSLNGQIIAMKEHGISLLEIRGVDGKNVSELVVEEARSIKKILDDNGIAIWSIGSPYGKIDISDDFKPHLEKFKQTLEVAKILGAKRMRIFSFYGEKDFDRVIDRLKMFLSLAQDAGILLCHENEKGIYGDSIENCLRLYQALPEMKAVFDPANFIQCGQDVQVAWDILKEYVAYIHVKDALPDGQVVPAGKGIANFPYILKDYEGVLSIEPHLSIFDGFANLEKEQSNPFLYADSLTAFSAAVTAIKEIIQ